MKKIGIFVIFLIIFGVGVWTYRAWSINKSDSPLLEAKSWPPKTNDENGLSIDVTPISLSPDKSAQFEIAFNTHQGNLDFDLTSQALLFDDKGNEYRPVEWQGGRDGHHLSGILIFPPPKEEMKQFKLIIKNIYGINERVFEWNLE